MKDNSSRDPSIVIEAFDKIYVELERFHPAEAEILIDRRDSQ